MITSLESHKWREERNEIQLFRVAGKKLHLLFHYHTTDVHMGENSIWEESSFVKWIWTLPLIFYRVLQGNSVSISSKMLIYFFLVFLIKYNF